MPDHMDAKFRLLGLLPLLFFLGQVVHYWRYGGLGHLLWMCNVGNLLLAVGIFLGHRELIRAAAIWTVPGLAIWGVYVLKGAGPSSTLAHVGGIIVAVIVVRRVKMDRLAWLYAFAWYLLMQLAARLLTSSELNVNVAHRIQSGWEGRFSSYGKFWLLMTMLVALVLWLTGKFFTWLWPAITAEQQELSEMG
jgi:hypothetical protein